MDRTPIKVRGKRGAGKPTAAKTPKSERREARIKAVKLGTSSGSASAALDHIARKRGASLERKLPLEILERIFILSQNPNFPRSSLFLGSVLSSRVTLVNFTIAAFHDSWELRFGRPGLLCENLHEGRDDANHKFQVCHVFRSSFGRRKIILPLPVFQLTSYYSYRLLS
jgi:hypothetical protein